MFLTWQAKHGLLLNETCNSDLRVAPEGGDGTGAGTGAGTGTGEGTRTGDGAVAGAEQKSDGIDDGFQRRVAASQIALLSPDPDVQVYVTIVPAVFPIFEAVAPVGATGESEAHSVSQTAFISASAPTPPPTVQLYPEPWTHPVPEEDQRNPPQLSNPLLH